MIHVAVGAVVENMSTVHINKPIHASSPPWESTSTEHLRVLISLRGQKSPLANHWELPGGKIESNEPPEQAVLRELHEELGIHVQPVTPLSTVTHSYEYATVKLLPYICQRTAGLPQAIQVRDLRWVRLDQLDQFNFPAATLPVLDALLNTLNTPKNNPRSQTH